MKKLIILFTILSICNAFAQSNQGSNPGVVDLAANPVIQGGSGVLDAAFQNSGFDPMPANTFTVSFNIDDNKLEWVSPVYDETTNQGDWTLVSQTMGQVTYRNTNGIIAPSEVMIFALKIKVKSSAPTGPALNAFSMNVRVTPGQAANAGNTDASPSDDNKTGALEITSALPVTLASFKVLRENQTALLSWSTTSESNSDYFDVERSLNAKNWNLLERIKSKGESSELENYSLIDAEPSDGENFYRLKMVDKDGTFAYSRIQSVTFDGILNKSMVYPNPASDFLKLNVSDMGKVKTVKMYDLNGRLIYSAFGDALTKMIDIKKVISGMYVVEIVNLDGQIKTSKISIIK